MFVLGFLSPKREIFRRRGSCLVPAPTPEVSHVFFGRPAALRPSFAVSLISSAAAARVCSQSQARKTERCAKVPFSSLPRRRSRRGAKGLHSGFLLFVPTNKSLCLKPCVGGFLFLFPGIPGRHRDLIPDVGASSQAEERNGEKCCTKEGEGPAEAFKTSRLLVVGRFPGRKVAILPSTTVVCAPPELEVEAKGSKQTRLRPEAVVLTSDLFGDFAFAVGGGTEALQLFLCFIFTEMTACYLAASFLPYSRRP